MGLSLYVCFCNKPITHHAKECQLCGTCACDECFDFHQKFYGGNGCRDEDCDPDDKWQKDQADRLQLSKNQWREAQITKYPHIKQSELDDLFDSARKAG